MEMDWWSVQQWKKLGIWAQFLNVSLHGCIMTKFGNDGRAAYVQKF